MTDVRENCRRVFDRISSAAARTRRDPASIRLIAVTKTVSTDRIRVAVESGITELGENRLQDAVDKRNALRDFTVVWHFIGHLQTNKARKVTENFDWIHSVDRIDLAQKLNQYAVPKYPILVEVELGNEETKSGVSEDNLHPLVEALRKCANLDIRGFMAIPPYFDDAEKTRPFFARLRAISERFGLPELSMGMSHDFEVAIEEGATMIRVGTALFGERV